MIKEGLYLVENEDNIIYLFNRLKNGEKKIEIIKDFKPYFYIPKNEIVLDKSVTAEYGYKSLFGEDVKKIIYNSPKQINELKPKFQKKFESDIIYTNRFLIDKIDDIIKSDYRIHYIDIETLSEGGFPDINTANQPIVCLTIYDNFDKKYYSWIWRKDFKEEIVNKDDNIIYKFPNEYLMLKSLVEFVKNKQPDIITGWNV